MNAVRLHPGGKLQLHTDEPEPRAEASKEETLRITSVGLCGSDLHWFEDGGIGDAKLEHPLVLGHEFAAVLEGGPHDGKRVAVDPAVPCETCTFCREGHPNLCRDVRFSGHGAQDGALREYMSWPRKCLHPLPDNLSNAEGALLEPLGVAIHAVDLGNVETGMTVGVFGCGPIGLLVLQVAQVAGATQLLATDTRAHRLEAVRTLMGDEAGTFEAYHDGSEGQLVREAAEGKGVDVAFEAAGDNAAVEAAVDALRPGGQLVLLGIPSDDRTSFCASAARRKGLTIKLTRRMKHVYPRAIALAEQGRVNLSFLVTHRFGLEDYDEAFEIARRREGLKVVVEPT